MAPKASTSRVKTDDDDSDDIDHSSPEATPAPSEGTNGPRVIPDYDPPEGYKPAKYGKEAQSDFDLDSILQDDDVELWLLKPKHLEGLACPARGARTTFKAKKRHYAVFDAPPESEKRIDVVPMLPSSAKENKLFLAPSKPITRRLHIDVDRRDKPPEDTYQALRPSARDRHPQPKGLHYAFTPFASGRPRDDDAASSPTKKRRKA